MSDAETDMHREAQEAAEAQAGYVPNTHSAIPTGAVVGSGWSERKAPSLMVLYACPQCGRTVTLNAYDGVPSCTGGPLKGGQMLTAKEPHMKVFLEGVRLAT